VFVFNGFLFHGKLHGSVKKFKLHGHIAYSSEEYNFLTMRVGPEGCQFIVSELKRYALYDLKENVRLVGKSRGPNENKE